MRWRVRRQHLDEREPRDKLVEVVTRLCGVQAQLMSAAELALWARVEKLEPGAVRQALWEERALVKTWAMRGTLHLLPASELHLWQVVPQLDRRYLRPAWIEYFGVNAGDLERMTDAITCVLDRRFLTREELVTEVSELLGSAELGGKLRHSWGMMLKPAAFRCRLCFAPSVGQNVRFTRPDTWLPAWREVDPAWAEAEATRRFLAAYGPVMRDVYSQWFSLARSRAGELIRDLGDEVAPVDVEGTPAWALTRNVAAIAGIESKRSVRLLPAFDQYVLVAARDAPNFLPGPFKDRIYRPQGWLSPVVLVNGRMDGIWKHERKGKRLLVTIQPFIPLPVWVKREIEREAERLAVFLGGSLELIWGAP